MKLLRAWLVAAAWLSASTCGAQTANVAAGRAAFGVCASCHGVEPNAKRVGPTLFGVIGRKAGAAPGFAYSPAMAASGEVWTKARLDQFLTAPRSVVPGSKMIYPGLQDAKARANLIAYLATLN